MDNNQIMENEKTNKECIEDSTHLSDFLNERVIRLRVKLNTAEDAIRETGILLVEEGVVEPCYVDAMVTAVKQRGPYIVVAPGVAIPHAAPSAGVKKLGIALVTLEPPIDFGNKENDPVYICIAFASPDNEQHIGLLSRIAHLIKNNKDLGKLKEAWSKQEVLKIIKNY